MIETLHLAVHAPREARRAISRIAAVARHPDLLFTVQLLATELVGNVERHTGLRPGDPVSVILDSDEQMVRVEVVDRGDGFNPLDQLRLHSQPSTPPSHGLALVDALADRWGYRSYPGDTHVWVELDLVPGRRPWRGRSPTAQSPRTATAAIHRNV